VGRQVVVPPSVHPDTERKYVWDPLAPETEPVPFAPERLTALLQQPTIASVASDKTLSVEWLETALEALDVRNYSEHSTWVDMAMSCHEATGGEGLDVFVAFCAGDPAHVGKLHTVPVRWASFSNGKDRRVTRRTLFEALHKAGRGDIVTLADEELRSPAAEDFPPYDGQVEAARKPDLIDRMAHLDRGALPTTAIFDWAEGPVTLDPVSKGELLEDYDRFLKANRVFSAKASHRALATSGRALGLYTARAGGGKERHWTLPPLAEARRAFEETLGASDLFE
jgi:Primase C terminal 2 (PriCT-2)